MSRLDDLIAELCPDGVEYKKLGNIATDMYRGSGIKRDQVTETGTPCVRYGEIYTTYNIWFDTCVSYINPIDIQNGKYFGHGDILFAITGESVDEIAKSCVYIGYEKCLAGSDIVVMKHNEDPKYLSYALSSTSAQGQKSKGKVKSKVVHSSIPALQAIEIPIPPLPVQEEIVRILDKFTMLEAELEAELEARKKQYDYYRDELLNFEHDAVRWMMLGDVIISLNTGLNPRQFFRLNTDDAHNYYVTIREIQLNQIIVSEKTDRINDEAMRLCNNRSNLEVGDVLFSGTGTIGETAIIEENPINWNIKEGVYAIKPIQEIISSRFLMYLLKSQQIRTRYMKKAAGGIVKSVPMRDMRKLTVPVPPLAEQERIVAILDRFDALVNDITIGLPAEIEARRKQNEYYRDKLLTFKEAVS
jgi:type I restriction enzyme S subunit